MPNAQRETPHAQTPRVLIVGTGIAGMQAALDIAGAGYEVLLVERPRLEFAYDTDPKQSAATRVRILDMLATQKIPLMAYHFPWPGLGHVSKHGDGFRYHATPMEIVPIPPKKA